jgi:hypothetical protein
VSTRIESIDKDIALIFAQDLSPEAMSRQFAEFAQETFDEADVINESILGRKPTSQTFVDGREGAPPSSVKPTGRIVREYQLVPDALSTIRDMLRAISPRLTGRYRASHTLFADNVEVPEGAPVPIAERYALVSTVPYARKLEKLFEVYGDIARDASGKFGNSLKIKLGFESVRGGDVLAWARSTRMKHRRRSNVEDWFTRQPAIIVTMR